MPAPRFYCTNIGHHSAEIDDDEATHARRVLRLTPGARVELFDGRGTFAVGEVQSVAKSMFVQIDDRRTLPPQRPRIDLAVAIPKGDRAAVLVEKAAELGADRLIPMITDRSVVNPGSGKRQRFERIALEAAKQCNRPWLMQIAPPIAFSQLLDDTDADLRLIADTSANSEPAKPQIASDASIIILIGPEGGWTDLERRAARDAGFTPWHFAPHVLRIETAAIAALAILRYGA